MISVAIDGPGGAGKSTISRAIASRLSIIHVDTGALYRAIGLYALRKGADTTDPAQVVPLLKEIDITLKFTEEGQKIYLNGEDVSQEIRIPEASMAASNVSAIPAVRDFLLDLQRELAGKNNVIMDGRDIGTVVLPGADIKIFLTASPEIRARRRWNELKAKGFDPDFDALLSELLQRDYNDTHRKVAPLRQADDAWLCDTSDMDFDTALAAVEAHIKEKAGL